ncbi:Transposase DDE domain-containing protein [Burkholderia sp. b13]|nr:Transposase DDE domain-containing protein [Burkholderia sp. b13]
MRGYRHDSMAFERTLPAVPGLNGSPCKRPGTLHADKDYDFARCRRYLKQRAITASIAHRGVEKRERLGRHCWVVEHTHAWLAGFGKLHIRSERRLDIYIALLCLAAAVICSRFVDDLC